MSAPDAWETDLLEALLRPVIDPSAAATMTPLLITSPDAPLVLPPPDPAVMAEQAHTWTVLCPTCRAVTTLRPDGTEQCLLCRPPRPDPFIRPRPQATPAGTLLLAMMTATVVALGVAGIVLHTPAAAILGFALAGLIVLTYALAGPP